MTFNWLGFLEVAERLNNLEGMVVEEAYYRASISRSYYGVFCLSRDRKDLTHYKPKHNSGEPGIHKKVLDEYEDSGNENEKIIGNNLSELWRRRVSADYEAVDKNNVPITLQKGAAERALSIAHEISVLFGEIDSKP